jgi:hypothetical protein
MSQAAGGPPASLGFGFGGGGRDDFEVAELADVLSDLPAFQDRY